MMSSYFEAAMAEIDLDVFGLKMRLDFIRSTLPNKVTFFFDVLSLIFPLELRILLIPVSVVYGFGIKYMIAIAIYWFVLFVLTEIPTQYIHNFRPAEERLRSHWVEMLSLKKNKKTCKHGCNIPSPDHVVAKFMNDYTLMNLREKPRWDRMNFLFDENYESIAVVENSKQRNMAILIMASIGTNIILDMQDTRKIERAIIVAEDILLMETIEKDLKVPRYARNDPAVRNIFWTIDKLKGGGQREVIRFFSKRIACNCLKQSYEEAKKAQPTRLGICAQCGPGKDRDSLLLCQRCKYVQYCSRECQKAHWPEHKLVCETCVKSTKNKSRGKRDKEMTPK